MSKNRNDRSPTAALREPMRGTPDGAASPGNPWDLMLKTYDQHPKKQFWQRLPRIDWTYLLVLLAVAALVIGVCLWLYA